MMTPTKNDSNAISIHTSSFNAKDRKSIGMTPSLAGRTRSPGMNELRYCYEGLLRWSGSIPGKIFFGDVSTSGPSNYEKKKLHLLLI
jgi:hypothetical protein